MAKAPTERFTAKRQAIVDAGARILNRTGLSAFRLADVAAETGLKRPSIVYYFANTEDLAETIYSGALDQIEQRVGIALKAPDRRSRLTGLIDLELRHHAAERAGKATRRPQLGELRALSAERRRKLGQRYDAILTRVSAMLEVDRRAGRLINRIGPAQLVMESIFWLPAWIDEYEPWMFDHVRDSMVDVLLSGYAANAMGTAAPAVLEPLAERKPGQEHKDAVDREDFLRTATRLICNSGFRGSAVDRIARELGVTKGSFYHHLDEKSELIEACFAHSQNRLSEIQKRTSKQGLSSVESLSTVLSAVARIQLDGRFPLLRTSALPALSAAARAEIIAQSRRNIRWYETAIAGGVADGTLRAVDPHIAAQILGVAVNAVYDLTRLYSGSVSAVDAPAFCALLERGIAYGTEPTDSSENPGLQSKIHERSMENTGREKKDY